MPAASVAIVVYPHMYATALASLVEARGHSVTAPDVIVEELDPTRHYDVVIASVPVQDGNHIRVELPDDYANPVRISAAGVVVELIMDAQGPLEHLLDLLDRLLRGPSEAAARALLQMAESGPPAPR